MPHQHELRDIPDTVFRRLIDSFTQRRPIQQTLMVVLVVALAPLAVLAAVQGLDRLSDDARRANFSLGEWVLRTSEPENNPIERVQTVVDLLALHPDARLYGSKGCSTLVATARQSLPSHVTLVVADESNLIRCSSDPSIKGNLLQWETLVPGAFMRLGPKAVEAQAADSRVAALIGLESLASHTSSPQRSRGAVTLLADGTGKIMAGARPLGWQSVPLDGEAGYPLAKPDANGQDWIFVHAPLYLTDRPQDSLHLVFVRPRASAFGQDWWFFASSFVVPLVALLLASVAIWVGANHSILRWITELRHITSLIGEGNYRIPVERFEDAPIEIRALAADAQRMARTISERDRTLTDALERQKALTLELNHRVRNNLQLISSYLTMQLAKTPDGQHGSLEDIRLRVNALALVHRLLYTDYERAAVRADILVGELANLLLVEFGGPLVQIHAPSMPVGVDAAVPIALSVVEARSWLHDVAGPEFVLSEMTLASDGDEATLRFGLARKPPTGDLPTPPRLLASFARQLRGQLRMETPVPGRIDLVLSFPSSNLDEFFTPSVGNIAAA